MSELRIERPKESIDCECEMSERVEYEELWESHLRREAQKIRRSIEERIKMKRAKLASEEE